MAAAAPRAMSKIIAMAPRLGGKKKKLKKLYCDTAVDHDRNPSLQILFVVWMQRQCPVLRVYLLCHLTRPVIKATIIHEHSPNEASPLQGATVIVLFFFGFEVAVDVAEGIVVVVVKWQMLESTNKLAG